jgi:hypothetical protein
MKKLLLTSIAALFLATGTAHATEDGCAIVLPVPVKVKRDKDYNPDMWLSIREGPGKQFKMIFRVHHGDLIDVDTRSAFQENENAKVIHVKRWTHVIGVPRLDGNTHPYVRGWISDKYIQWFECREDQEAEGNKPWPAPMIDTIPTIPEIK